MRRRSGQASLEMTVAMLCLMTLLFGSVKVFLWLVERVATRQVDYSNTRVEAGSCDDPCAGIWNDKASKLKLKIFN